jgi:formyl-CoA transferase
MRPYQAGDGRWLQFNMVRSEELLSLMFAGLDALHLLADERFATAELMMEHRALLGDLIQEIVAQKSSDEWLAVFADLGVPVNRVARVEDAVTDPQVLLNGMAEPAQDTLGMPLVVRHPIRVSSAPPVTPVRAPELGEHSDQILHEIGYTAEQIAGLRERNAI